MNYDLSANLEDSPAQVGVAMQELMVKGHVKIPLAAIILQRHPQTIHHYVKAGWIRHIRVGLRIHITKDEIARFQREGNYTGDAPNDTQHPAADLELPLEGGSMKPCGIT